MPSSDQTKAVLSTEDFTTYFEAIHGVAPFRWQERLAEQVCTANWPEVIDLPTSSGKTATVDIAIFALAYQALQEMPRSAPRRIFFVVDRRIIVNQAYRQADRIADMLYEIQHGVPPDHESLTKNFTSQQRNVLQRVAAGLMKLADDETAPPLDCFELRGGIYRNDAWIRSPLQPTVITTTVDQFGSRLLFRGYGVTDRNLSIHAGLTANDSLILLDEAHCSKPFQQTIKAVERYRKPNWSPEAPETPFQFVSMTATPRTSQNCFRLTEQDYEADPVLQLRHGCSKPVQLVLTKGKGRRTDSQLTKQIAHEALQLAKEHGLRKIAVVVNRVSLARDVCSALKEANAKFVDLVIGRMRPFDRDGLTKKLIEQFGSNVTDSNEPSPEVQFVVATQCLEVGADFDFDGMVSQCASLDALRQRFGRLNRLGKSPDARGVIVASEGELAPLAKLVPQKPLDPIYNNASAYTWHWLTEHAIRSDTEQESDLGIIDFGVQALDALLQPCSLDVKEHLASPAPNAPILLPAHLNLLCQTSPRPAPDPDISKFLHGVGNRVEEIRVCWRADLDLGVQTVTSHSKNWAEAVDLCPPSTGECLTVPLRLFRRWLRGESAIDTTGDMLGEKEHDEETAPFSSDSVREVLVWRGTGRKEDGTERSFVATAKAAYRIRPNDTVVIPAEFGGWTALGHVPDAPPDPAETPKFDPYKLHQQLMAAGAAVGAAVESDSPLPSKSEKQSPKLRELIQKLHTIDLASRVFRDARNREILRVHPKLPLFDLDLDIWKALLNLLHGDGSTLRNSEWKNGLESFADKLVASNDELPSIASQKQACVTLLTIGGELLQYQEGVAWISKRIEKPSNRVLPDANFGDETDGASQSEALTLLAHTAQVVACTKRLFNQLLPSFECTAEEAARIHDLGKALPRFQCRLLNQPLSNIFMQRTLWAKSPGNGRSTNSYLPSSFRHEALSLHISNYCHSPTADIDRDLALHFVGSHHGHCRPAMPVFVDDQPTAIDLSTLFNEEGQSESSYQISEDEYRNWAPAHRLDSGVAERFWYLNDRFGWWGLAYLESLFRMADWQASGNPQCSKENETESREALRANWSSSPIVPSQQPASRIIFSGINGSNSLAFLAALGTLRTLTLSPSFKDVRMHWEQHSGAWRPVVTTTSEVNDDRLADELFAQLTMFPQESLFRAIGPNLTCSGEEFRTILSQVIEACHTASEDTKREAFVAAEFLAAFGCDSETVDDDPQSVIKDTALRTMSGAGHQHFLAFMLQLHDVTRREHISAALFHNWDYRDSGRGLNLRWDPTDDRRYALRWINPSDDPVRTMLGANRLAIEAIPLFPTAPTSRGLETTGFDQRQRGKTLWTWPIWTTPLNLDVCRNLLQSPALQMPPANSTLAQRESLQQKRIERGISAVFQSQRITTGKFRNFTPAIALQ